MSITQSTLSTFPFSPLSASYIHDENITFSPVIQQYNDGFIVVSHPIYNNSKDLAINKKTSLVVSDELKLSDVISDTSKEITRNYDGTKIKIYTAADNKYVTWNGSQFVALSTITSSDAAIFTILENFDGTISLRYDNNYVVVDSVAPYNLITTSTPVSTEHIFQLQEINDIFYISSTYNFPYRRFLKSSNSSGNPMRAIGTSITDESSQFKFIFMLGGVSEITLDGLNTDSKYVKYYSEDSVNTKNVNILSAISGVSANYLVTLPYEANVTFNITNTAVEIGKMEVDFNALKNIKTTNYEYTTVGNSINHRNYNNIFVGSNEENGYENICLGFESDNAKIKLYADSTTYFHYPSTAQSIHISGANLFEQGAIASNIPLYADKIWKKNANYAKYLYWGNSLLPSKNGTWLCSWLSGNDVNAKWVDRWYNPNNVSLLGALTSITPLETNSNPSIIDIESNLTLDPGVWYKFFHGGNQFVTDMVSSFSISNSAMLLNYNTWEETNIIDKSVHENNGIIVNFNKTDIKTGLNDKNNESVLELSNDKEYLVVPYSNSLDITDQFSWFFWIYMDNWSDQKNMSLVDQGQKNQWSIKYNNGFNTPYFIMIDETNKALNAFNANGVYYIHSSLIYNDSEIVKTDLDENLYTWNLDSSGRIIKINQFGVTDAVLTFSENIKDFTKDANNNLWVLGSSVSAFADNLTLLSSISADPTATLINIDLSGNCILTTGDKTIIDNSNYVWTLSADELYRDGTLVYTGSYIKDFSVDRNGIIWILHNLTQITTIDILGSVQKTIDISGSTSENSDRAINFISKDNEDFALVYQKADNTIYVYDLSLNIVDEWSIDVQDGVSYNIWGDFTGYQWHRKFNYLQNDGICQIEAKLFMEDYSNIINIKKLKYGVDNLDRGWHQIGLVYNGDIGKIDLYIDGVIEDTKNVPIGTTLYTNKSNDIYIGEQSGNTTDLDTEMLLPDYFWSKNIKIGDVRYYSEALSNYNIKMLYLNGFNIGDIDWYVDINKQFYVEEVSRFFKHKLPGLKSQYYNIKINGLGITDNTTRSLIEDIIKDVAKKVTPAYTQLYKIIWDE